MRNSLLKLSKIESAVALLLLIGFLVWFVPSAYHEIRVHDTFDGNFSTRHVLIHSGHFFSAGPHTEVPGIMNGLPRGVFPRFTEITSLLMFLFGSLNGYALTFIIVRLLAAIGIYRLGKDHLMVPAQQNGLLLLVSCTFACLPFFIIHGLTVAGVPLALWAFLNLHKRQRKAVSYLTLALFALWSNFVLVGFHLVLCLGLLAIYFSFRDKRPRFDLFLATAFLAVIYVLSDYMLFDLHLFSSSYHSSRGQMERATPLNLAGVAGGTIRSFFTGDYSTANYLGFIFLPAVFLALFYRTRQATDERYRLFFVFLCLTAFCAFFVNLLDWTKFSFFYEKVPMAKEFNFKRFTSLLPGFFFVLVLAAFAIVNARQSFAIRIASSISVVLLFAFVWRGNISYNRSAFDTRGVQVISEQQTTFQQFFDPLLYRQIKRSIGADTLRNVIHFGISSSASKYAGLRVLDDYQGDYPRDYKAQFRRIIAGELDKSDQLQTYFDNWGSRCYMESANSFGGSLQEKNGLLIEPQLAINTTQLKEMNCAYVISAIVIGNAAELNLSLQRVLVGPESSKVIFLYKLI